MTMSENFRELSDKLGGFDPVALNSFFYWNNPFTLKHWTMNVVEIVMCAGAVLALIHALRVYRHTNNATNLCFWIISVGYLFVTEIPLYFPALVGGDPNELRFLHNEFTAGFIYDRTPAYIVALYPALTYPAYVLIERTGIFERKWGLLAGAVSVGFLHHCFYEIFDHFGPQYGWWVWNDDMYTAFVASVPLASVYTFAFIGPVGLTLVTRMLIVHYLNRKKAASMPTSVWQLAVRCLLAPFAVFVALVIFTPDLYYQIFLPARPSPFIEQIVSLSIIAIGAVVALIVNASAEASRTAGLRADAMTLQGYAMNFLIAYLVIFAALWIYALPEYMNAKDGITDRGTPIGSLAYTMGCYVFAMVILYQNHASAVKIPGIKKESQAIA